MTIGEFKAFIEGMNVDEHPTKEQWGRIAEKIASLNEPTPASLKYKTKLGPPPIPYDFKICRGTNGDPNEFMPGSKC